MERMFGSNYYVQIYCGETPTSLKTGVEKTSRCPVWNQRFYVDVPETIPFLKLFVWDFENKSKSHFMGVAKWTLDRSVQGGNLRLDLGPRPGNQDDMELMAKNSGSLGFIDIQAIWSHDRNMSALPLFTLS